jgi:hypothetical protein
LVKILAIFSRTPCLLTESHDVWLFLFPDMKIISRDHIQIDRSAHIIQRRHGSHSKQLAGNYFCKYFDSWKCLNSCITAEGNVLWRPQEFRMKFNTVLPVSAVLLFVRSHILDFQSY